MYLAVFIVMVAGSTLQSSVGMGQGLLAAPLLRLLEPDLLPGPIVLAGFLTGAVLAMRNSKRTDAREVAPALLGRFVGAGVAIGLLALLSDRGLTIMIGVIVLALVAARLTGLKIPRKPATLAGTGFVSPIVLAGFLTGAVLAMRNSKRTDAREVAPALLGRFVGAGVAIGLLALLSDRGLTIMIGVIVLALVAARLTGLKIPRKPATLAGTGFVSGISGTIAALGGAPMGLLYEQHARARDFRGPMGVFQMIGGVASVLMLTVAGQMDGRAWALGFALLPPLMLGWLLARWVTPVVDRGLLGPVVLIMSGVSATALILSEVL